MLADYFKGNELTPSQADAVASLGEFLAQRDMPGHLGRENRVFLLKGYAGTGKTFLLQGIAGYLQSIQRNFVVMAPTGRAAKVIRDRAGLGCTIHKAIYSDDKLAEYKERIKTAPKHSSTTSKLH